MISYHDVLLRESDLELLKGPYWLNDQIVEFFFEYLQYEVVNSSDICLLGGATTFFILNGDSSDVEASLSSLNLRDKKVIIFAVNDNPDISQAEGGSHWSLLVFDNRESAFLHLDSMREANSQVAMKLALKCVKLLSLSPPLAILSPSVIQQRNSYDCALFMLKFAEALSTDISSWTVDSIEELKAIKSFEVSHFRKTLMELIYSKRDT